MSTVESFNNIKERIATIKKDLEILFQPSRFQQSNNDMFSEHQLLNYLQTEENLFILSLYDTTSKEDNLDSEFIFINPDDKRKKGKQKGIEFEEYEKKLIKINEVIKLNISHTNYT